MPSKSKVETFHLLHFFGTYCITVLSIYCKTKPAAIRQRGRIFTALALPTTPLDLWSRNSWNQVSVCHLHSCFADEKVTQNKKITSKIDNLELIEISPDRRGAERLWHEGKGGWVHREPGLVAGRGRTHHLLGCRNGSSTTWRNFLHQVWSLAQLLLPILFLDLKSFATCLG